MGAVWYRFVRLARLRRWSLGGLCVLIAVAGGLSLGAASAAHRADTAYARMVARTAGWQVLVKPYVLYDRAIADRIVRLPQVSRSGLLRGLEMVPDPSGHPDAAASFPGAMSVLHGLGYGIGRPALRDGRMPDPTAVHEVFLDESYADPHGIRVGDHLAMRVLPDEPILGAVGALPGGASDNAFADAVGTVEGDLASGRTGVPVELVVTGIGTTPDSVVQDPANPVAGVWTTPAFWNRYRAGALWWAPVVTLRHGESDLAAFRHGVQSILPADGSAGFQTVDATATKVAQSVDPQVAALEVFALVMAVVALLVVGQAIARLLGVDAVDNEALQALGSTRRQRTGVNVLVVAALALVGSVLAVLVSIAVSPFMPVGAARVMDPSAGPVDDPLLLTAGGAVVVVGILLAGVLPAWRAAGVGALGRPARSSGVADALARAGGGTAVTTGARFALESDGRRGGVRARATMVTAATGVSIVVAALTFAGSLATLVGTPSLYGSGWDTTLDFGSITNSVDAQLGAALGRALDGDHAVRAYSQVNYNEVVLDGHPVPAIAFTRSSRPALPTVVEGRAPERADEIALAAGTAAELGATVGGHVDITSDGARTARRLTVVGTVVLPGIGSNSGSDKTAPGRGALVTPATLTEFGGSAVSQQQVVASLVAGADRAALGARMTAALAALPGAAEVVAGPAAPPSDVVALTRLRRTPVVLAGVVVLLVAATVAHALVTEVRRRRFDFAVLKVLGETRRQILSTVVWQSSVTSAVALVVGLPVGVVCGRWAWRSLAAHLGVVAHPTIPVAVLGLTALAVFVLSGLVSLVPGYRVSRMIPSRLLRSE